MPVILSEAKNFALDYLSFRGNQERFGGELNHNTNAHLELALHPN